MDLLIQNARLRGHADLMCIGIRNGRIAEIAPELPPDGREILDAGGFLTTPAFVEPHTHLDKALISDRMPPNLTQSSEEARRNLRDEKRRFTVDDVQERARTVLGWALAAGVTAIRTHVDVDTAAGLTGLEGVLALREKMAEYVDLQIVAMPQHGIFSDPGTAELLEEALRMGADVIGGFPEEEFHEEAGRRHLDFIFELAKRFDVPIDMHLDIRYSPKIHYLHDFAHKTLQEGFIGRVAAGHVTALPYYDPYEAAHVIGVVKRAGMSITTCPPTTMMLGARLYPEPRGRGITRVKDFLQAGVNIAFAQDNVLDPFNENFGDADPLKTGFLTAYAAQLGSREELETLFDMATEKAAKVMALQNYGLAPGCRGDLVVTPVESVRDAFRLSPPRAFVIRRGKVIAEAKVTRRCAWEGKPADSPKGERLPAGRQSP
ncbi:MAG: amidohydrolase family protein [bacterium]